MFCQQNVEDVYDCYLTQAVLNDVSYVGAYSSDDSLQLLQLMHLSAVSHEFMTNYIDFQPQVEISLHVLTPNIMFHIIVFV